MITDRQIKVLEILEETYKGSTTALEFKNPFELLIATILSAQTTDNQVNKITRNLFSKYPTPEKFRELSYEQLAYEIRTCGLYKNKAKNILQTVEILLEEYKGEVPQERESLLTLPGVGRKTANVVLSGAFNIPALAVDTHVFRVSKRLGLAHGNNVDEVEVELTKIIPENKWADSHHWLIWHGRKVCKARNPLCGKCVLFDYCTSTDKKD